MLGCGYLGLRLVRSARERGWTVKAVSRNEQSLAEAAAMGATVFAGQLEESGWRAWAGGGVDFVVNCVSAGGGGLEGYQRSYIEGNRAVVDWARETGFAGTAVYTSSVSVYGDKGGGWVDEVQAPPPSGERGKLVLESEAVFREGLAGGGAFVLRLAGLYGPGRHLMLDSVRAGPASLAGWGDYFLNLVRIEDVVSAIWSIRELDPEGRLAGGTYNVVDDAPSLKSDIVAWLAERCGQRVPVFTGVPGVGSSRRLGEEGRPANRRISNRSLRAATGWSPRFASYREGFEDLLVGGR